MTSIAKRSKQATTSNGNQTDKTKKNGVKIKLSDPKVVGNNKMAFNADEILLMKEKLNGGISVNNLAEEHLPPLSLTIIVLFCSGCLLVLSLRDFLMTGKNIGGRWDEGMLEFTKSTQWYDGSKGWKSTQGGFSAIMSVTTDRNNMGGFFIRKICGAAGIAVHLQKLMPLALVHEHGSQWNMGHFHVLLWTAIIANAVLAVFYGLYMSDFKEANVIELPYAIIFILGLESTALLIYIVRSPSAKLGPATALPLGKEPSSRPSNIVRNTCFVVTTFFGILALRDLFVPGFIIPWLPRDDIYLEWTNAFLHSPPEGSTEAADHGLEAPLFIGDKFICQLSALHVLINCLYKYVSSVGISYRSDGSGLIRARMMWKVQAIGCALMWFVYRSFTHAASSASFDMRWHLMMLMYETFIFASHGFM